MVEKSVLSDENPIGELNMPEVPDPEVAAVRQILKLLDKASKSYRTYGPNNSVAQKFFQQFYTELSTFLSEFHVIGLLVQRSELLCKGESVYQAQEQGENLAFKLYADGIRELTLHENLTEQDLSFFLESLWENVDTETADDDIVTRLWEKNLSSIGVVTAEEIMQASGLGKVLSARDSGTLDSPVSSLKDVNESERARSEEADAAPETQEARKGKSSFVIGYEISPEELETLAKQIEAESSRDNPQYILDMLSAILQCESSPAILQKLFDIFGIVLSSLTQEGKWVVMNTILTLLEDVREFRTDLSDEHKQKVSTLLETMGQPERIKEVETFINTQPDVSTEGFLEFLLHIKHRPVQSLCQLLGNIESQEHRTLVLEALAAVATDNLVPVMKGLQDRRDRYVQDLLILVAQLSDNQFVAPLEKLMQHKNIQIRKEALRLLGVLSPGGSGKKILSYLLDGEPAIRLTALTVLTNGTFTATFDDWAPIVTEKGFLNRPLIEKRGIFKALRLTAGEEAIPHLRQWVTAWSWFKRKKKDELALLAVGTLKMIASSAALAVLEEGARGKNKAVQQACTKALSSLSKSTDSSES